MIHQASFFTRRRLAGILGGLTLAVAQFFSPAGAGTAQAAPTCTNSGQTVTCTYPFTGAPESWTVPAGVTQATFQLVGAPGGRSGGASFAHVNGGRGADRKATLSLSPGADVVITVGGPGGTDGRETAGFNGGGGGRLVGNSFGLAGGGGGATDIRIGGTALTDRVLVAGGGGGGGSHAAGPGPIGMGGTAGGVGGDADTNGFSAPPNGRANGGGGGASGNTGGQGGAAGGGFDSNPGGNGSLGQGGTVAEGRGDNGSGGGGGGGYVGGGGGGAGGQDIVTDVAAGGGGGGGGSSFASASATNVTLTTDTTNVPKVVITYVDTVAPGVTINQAAGQADPTSSNPVLFSVNFSEPVTGFTSQDVTLSGTANLNSASVTVSGGPSSYTVSVAGLAGNGTVIATIGANLVSDLGGNGNTASTSTDNSVTVNFDSTPPLITPNVAGTLGNNGWYVSNVTVSWTVMDNESTITSQSGCGTENVTSDTGGVTFTCSATSAGGTASQSVTIKREATAPTITLVARTAANANGWNNSDVTVNWSCSDATAGAVAASVNQTVNGEGANQSATGTCTDNAGNSASNTQSGINIDKTAPTISAAATTAANGNGWYNSKVTVHFTCADALSGVTCPTDQVLSSEGSAVASTAQTVSDLAGNTSAPSNVVTVKIDKTAPTISAAATTQPNVNGWYNGNVTVQFTCDDNLSA